jgi:hypothetical protein
MPPIFPEPAPDAETRSSKVIIIIAIIGAMIAYGLYLMTHP